MKKNQKAQHPHHQKRPKIRVNQNAKNLVRALPREEEEPHHHQGENAHPRLNRDEIMKQMKMRIK